MNREEKTQLLAELNELFNKVAVEEEKIRTDASARVTDLLKDVFGQLD